MSLSLYEWDSLLLYGFWVLNSGHWAWQQTPLLASHLARSSKLAINEHILSPTRKSSPMHNTDHCTHLTKGMMQSFVNYQISNVKSQYPEIILKTFLTTIHFRALYSKLSTLSSLKHNLIILVPHLSRTEASTLRSSFFLSLIWSVSCIVGMLSFSPNIH